MKLETITINNFRSIENLELPIETINNSYTYSLLGINESGKSSFLKAISLINADKVNYPADYHLDSQPICIKLHYLLTSNEHNELAKMLQEKFKFDKTLLTNILVDWVDITVKYAPTPNASAEIIEEIEFAVSEIPNYTILDNVALRKTTEYKDLSDLNLQEFFNTHLKHYFWELSHNVVFWKSTPEYLILDNIDLVSFAAAPEAVSIPLFNCFALAGITQDNIQKEVSKLNSAVASSSLKSKLSELTTEHINKVWPEHPISVEFHIDSNKISLLIHDNEVKFKPKTTGQRSDGFKQFISFLLTISAENYNDELENTILLIDEPETHLHPPAQLNLLNELIKITSNQNNNILFFATHSNYLIDKENLERNYKVSKSGNEKTKLTRIEKKRSTYSEVNYEVFEIVSSDYHNELYGFIEAEDKAMLKSQPADKEWQDSRNNKIKEVSLSEYIRHSIHHPENVLNPKYTDQELKESIKILIELREKIQATNRKAMAGSPKYFTNLQA